MKHDFEDIEVKSNAPELLADALARKRRNCMIGTGAMCDPYMHCEEKLQLTRRCLEIIDACGFGLSIQTKSDRIMRDIDLLESINERAKCVAEMTLTTFDERLCGIIEPNVCTTYSRYLALKEFQKRKIPTVVWISPLLPFINDTVENLRGLLDYCFDAGVRGILCFGIGMTLRDGDREYYYAALDRNFPELKQRYIEKYGQAYEIASDNNDKLMDILNSECEKRGIMTDIAKIFAYLRELPECRGVQLSFF
jgi:DNA repair photolyase